MRDTRSTKSIPVARRRQAKSSIARRRGRSDVARSTPGRLLAVQRGAGNRATAELVQRLAKAPATPLKQVAELRRGGPAEEPPAPAMTTTATPTPSLKAAAPPPPGAPPKKAAGPPSKQQAGAAPKKVAAAPKQAGAEQAQQAVAQAGATADSGVPGEAEIAAAEAKQMAAVTKGAASRSKKMATSKPAAAEVAAVEGAAQGPANEAIAGGKAAQVGDMVAAPAPPFDKAGFVAAIEAKVNQTAPKTLEEADGFEKSGALSSVKSAVKESASGKKESVTKAVDSATESAPDPSRGTKKEGGPLAPQPSPPKPRGIKAAAAMPRPKPPASTDLSKPKHEADQQLAAADVTEQQLADSNEPAFVGALKDKKAGEEHSKNAPGPVRAEEANQIAAAKAGARADESAALGGMFASRQQTNQKLAAEKSGSKSKNEAERARVAQQLEAIYSKTQVETKAILDGIDPQVDAAFESGEAAARAAFENKYKSDLDRFKDRRYSGALGWTRWLEDKLTSPPPEVGRIIESARKLYLAEMRKVVESIADIVGRELTRAKERVAQGRVEITEYVQSLPKNLQKEGAELAKGVQEKLDGLESEVDAKKDALIDKVADRYKETKAAVDARVEEMKAENMGLWDRAKAAIAGVIQTIIELKNALGSALKKASGAITTIIKDPIGFLNNLIAAFTQGLQKYLGNIKKHLLSGVVGWLTGAMGGLGITLPAKFDLRGIVDLVLQILGITYGNIKTQIVKRLGPAGAKVIGRVEQGVALIGKLVAEGPIALWTIIVERITGLWDMVIGKIQDFVEGTIIGQGIQWLMSLINPAAAFIKACKMIVDGVMWLWNNAARIMQLIDTIAGSAMSIAKGAIGTAAGAIEKVLGRLTPILISFLANMLGLGGIADKVKEIITAVRAPVNKVIGKVVDKAVSFGRRLLSSPLGKKVAGGIKKAKAWGKKQLDKAKRLGDRAVQKAKQRVYGGDDSPEGKAQRLGMAITSAVGVVNKYAGKKVRRLTLDPQLKVIKLRRGIGHLDVIPVGGFWHVEGRVDRATPTEAMSDGPLQTEEAGANALNTEKIFAELSVELKLDVGKPSRRGTRRAVREAIDQGLVDSSGQPRGPITAAMQSHSVKKVVKRETGDRGPEWESAHLFPQAFGRGVQSPSIKYSAGSAITILLLKADHSAMDKHWMAWVRARNSSDPSGQATVTAAEAFDAMRRAIEQVTQGQSLFAPALQGVLVDQLRHEMFSQLGLSVSDQIRLPKV